MAQVDSKAHPYMPNSAGDTREEMLSAIGLQDVEELFEQIPEQHRLSLPLNLPAQLCSELDLKRHLL